MDAGDGRDHYFDANGLRLHYVEWGRPEAPPLVLLHGMASLARIWDFFAPVFAPEYHVLALDWRGHGDSEHAPADAYGFEHYVSDLSAFLAALDRRDVSIVAHSLGAWVALNYAAQSSERLRTLVALDFRAGFSEAEIEQSRQQSRRPHRELATADEAIERFAGALAPTAAPAKVLRQIGQHAIKQTPAGSWTLKVDRAALALSALDPWPVFRRVGVPVLLMRGAESLGMAHETIVGVEEAMPNARAVEIAGAYHHPFLDQPEAFIGEVQGFLRQQ